MYKLVGLPHIGVTYLSCVVEELGGKNCSAFIFVVKDEDTNPRTADSRCALFSWIIGFRHTWMPSRPGRELAAPQELCSGDYQTFSPMLKSCCPSSESCLPASSSPRNLKGTGRLLCFYFQFTTSNIYVFDKLKYYCKV